MKVLGALGRAVVGDLHLVGYGDGPNGNRRGCYWAEEVDHMRTLVVFWSPRKTTPGSTLIVGYNHISYSTLYLYVLTGVHAYRKPLP